MERKEFLMHDLVRLPPGFRFQPTDEELVVQYLRRKAMSFPLPAAIIPEIELGKLNPWDVPSGFGGDKYFFYLREGNCGQKKGRVYHQEKILGCWKATGKKKPVISASRGNELVGTKQVMVFHRGKPPHRSKTDWIMHEYSLCYDELLTRSTQGLVESGKEWVVCRIFAKRRSMQMGARKKKLEEQHQAPVTSSSSSSSSSCITDDLCDDEVSVNGDEAMSKNTAD